MCFLTLIKLAWRGEILQQEDRRKRCRLLLEGSMKKLKWYGVLFALVVLFLYIMGTYDIFMMLSHNKAYYLSKGFGEGVYRYFTDYPVPGLILWIGNLMGGLLAPILYLLKKKCAYQVAYASFLLDLFLILFGVAFRNRFRGLDLAIICFDIFILVITFLFAVYLHWQVKKLHRNGES